MTISNFVAYVKQAWKNKPDTSTPLSAPRLLHMEDGIKMTSDAIEKIAAAVVSQIVNDPDKIASMAALYAVDQKIGNVANLPNGAADVVAAITQQNSNFISGSYIGNGNPEKRSINTGGMRVGYIIWSSQGTAIVFYSGAYCKYSTNISALDGATVGSGAGGFWFKTDSRFLNADGVTYNYQSI